jgi:hypothetical protein
MLGEEETTGFLVVMNTIDECEARGICWNGKTLLRRSFPSSPSWTHGQARG